MMPAKVPPQRLSLVENATSRWISGATRRHPATLVIMTGVIIAGDLLGGEVDFRAYIVMAVWFALAVVEGPWCTRAPDLDERKRRYAIGLLTDVVMLGAAYYYLDAARIAGISAFLLIVVSARVVLSERVSQFIAVGILAAYVALLLVAVRTAEPVSSPVGLGSLTGNESFLAVSAVAAATVIYLVLRMQAHVLRTVQEAESRHQAVVNSAADMILVVDHAGRMVEVNTATLTRTGYTLSLIHISPCTLHPEPQSIGP